MEWRHLLDWEEVIFRALHAGWRRLSNTAIEREQAAGAIAFEDERARLSVFAQVLTGEPIRLRAAPGVGGLRGAEMLLPSRLCLAPDAEQNREALRAQIVVLAGMRRLGVRRPPLATTYEGALEALSLTRAAIDLMAGELPGFLELHDRVMARVLGVRDVAIARLPPLEAVLEGARRAALAGERPWTEPGLCSRLVGPRSGRRQSPPIPIWGEWIEAADERPAGPAPPQSERNSESPTTEIEAPAVSHLRTVDEKSSERDPRDSPPAVPFERVETLDRYRGGHRDLDGTDELEAHLDALEQVDLGDLIRSHATAGSTLRMDLDLGVEVADTEPAGEARRGIRYDEWDAREGRYRKQWCTVYATPARSGDTRWADAALRRHRLLSTRLRRTLEAQRAGLRPAHRQLDGEDIDLTSALDDHVDRRAGRGGDPRLYIRQQRRRRDFATLVLLDASMSTDSWVDGRRILDVAREAALVLGEVSSQLGDRLQILAFASETRNRCHVWQVLGEHEEWIVGKRRLGALEPTGYTRIGPALRHATAVLSATAAERRLLLLISDGKPTDYDRYEGRYGIADVRQAVREARAREIHVHAFAIDRVARDSLPALFGRGGFHVLPKPDQLVEASTSVYGRLTAS